jgi:amino acid permease
MPVQYSTVQYYSIALPRYRYVPGVVVHIHTKNINMSDDAPASSTALLPAGAKGATGAKKDKAGTAEVFPSVLNLTNNILGAGLFSMPWCLSQATAVSGALLLVLCACLNTISFVILCRCTELSGEYSYLKMGRVALGGRFGILVQSVVALYAVGSTISFVVLTGDFLVGKDTGLFEYLANNTILYNPDDETGSRAIVVTAATLLFFLPLGLLRKLDALKYTSFFGCLASLFAGVLTVYVYGWEPKGSLLPDESRDDLGIRVFGFPVSFWAAVPITNVAYTAHYNAPRFYQELRGRSLKRIGAVATGAMGFSMLLYGTVGIAGYLTFGTQTLGNVLKNYAPGFPLAVGARLALAIVVILTCPLAAHSLRSSILTLAYGDQYTTDNAPNRIIWGIACAVVLFCGVVGTLFTKVEVVLAYKGGIFGSMMVYIFPPLMLVALKVRERRERSKAQRRLNNNPEDGGAASATLVVSPDTPPAGFGETIAAMFKQRENWGLAMMFVWGVVGGILSVGVTILMQLGVVKT